MSQEDVTWRQTQRQSSSWSLGSKELMSHQFHVECLGNFTCSGVVKVVFLLLQKRLEALNALADLLSVVQAEEGILRGQLRQPHPAEDKKRQHKKTVNSAKKVILKFYMSSEGLLT